jgi:hypothetical protein
MTELEWVQMVNQIISKTRGGKINWQHESGGRRSRAVVGEFVAVLDYVIVRTNDRLLAQRGSLSLAVCTQDGRRVVSLTEADCANTPSQADDLALRSLFEAVIIEPHTKAIEGFRSALSDL